MTLEQCTPHKARQMLLANEAQNHYPLLRLAQGGVDECLVCGGSLCLHDAEHDKYVYAVSDIHAFETLYEAVRPRQGQLVSLLCDAAWQAPVQTLYPALQWHPCVQLRAVPFAGALPAVPGLRFGAVNEAVARWILTVYQHPELSVEFILRRAAAAPAVAAFVDDEPVGFFLTHSAAELGPVYVAPARRGSGLASALYAEMLRHLPTGPLAPVLFVFPENHASQKWLRRLGCVPAPRPVAWFWREQETPKPR